MMKISKDNYEAFYLDYLEGTLNDQDAELLMQFLEQYPELKEDFDGFDMLELQTDESVVFDKAALYKTINEENVEDYIIAELENHNNSEDSIELQSYLNKSAEAKQLSDRYAKTILPAENIVFPNKEELKKKDRKLFYIIAAIAAAAVAMLLVVVYSPSNNNEIGTIADLEGNKDLIVDTVPFFQKKTTVFVTDEHEPQDEKQAVALLSKKNEQEAITKDKAESVDRQLEAFNEDPEQNQIAENESSFEKPQIVPEDESAVFIEEKTALAKLNEAGVNEDSLGCDVSGLIASEDHSGEHPQVSEALTIKEWARVKVREKLIKTDKEPTEKIKASELIESVVTAIDKGTGENIALNYKKDEERSQFQFSIGGIRFSRSRNR